MRKPLFSLAALGMAVAVAASAQADLSPVEPEVIEVPSGQPVAFHESLLDRPAMGLTARFRFLAPELGTRIDAMSYDELEADLFALCEGYALPRIAAPEPSQIVISLAEAPTEFGVAAPDVVEVFEAYRPDGDTCAWEAF
ncbi:DUF6497 family protein [Celeribacter sp.]|uniref:DUF6497 family protein n=1 Tax=Celeribacter sp. TaxID=1890673 RepID=UPI003A8E0F90